ncbi:hypothetical protein [Nocardioides yefusunii]|uniref:Uncharacterized protein n=1 Tax=Nocardioides yefusunii TaxID=2500546 RepID=A0ABW1QXU2_9ACTN|nr:hypothetical protein [Nocardioides yefusunii]
MASREARQTAALVSLLKALPEAQLLDVLKGVDVALPAPKSAGPKDTRSCTICSLPYPLHMQRWGNDHKWSPAERRAAVVVR